MILTNWHLRIGETIFPCKIPCTLFSVLRENKLLENPYYGTNETKLAKYFDADAEFFTSFAMEKGLLEKKHIIIEFDCLDTLCKVYLNDELLAETDNFHRKWKFDVKERLHIGKNTLKLHFDSTVKYARKRMEKLFVWGNSEENGTLPGISYIRKPYYTFGWDWCPPIPDSGIVGSVRINATDYSEIRSIQVLQTHCSENVSLTVNTYLEGAGRIKTTLFSPQGEKIFSGDGASISITIPKPELWWPNGYGGQPLYRLQTERFCDNVKVDERIQNIGLRTISVEHKDDAFGKSFTFVCNGQKVFAKGANIVPFDCMMTEDVSDKIYDSIKECAHANYNMLRIWGGGCYGSDYFYDCCDKYGILVWQDVMIACAHICLDDSLEKSIMAEVEENLQRIRNYASLALICGNNEMEPCAQDLAEKKNFPQADKIVGDYFHLYENAFPALVKKLAPNTEYWPSSPSAGGKFYKTQDPDYGDSHFWKVWGELKPYNEYKKYYFRFLSEFGFAAFPPMASIKEFARPDDYNIYSEIMERHQKNYAGNAKMAYYLHEEFEFPTSFEMLVFATQYIQASALETAIAHLRSNYGRCMGTLYWQLNDAYPAISFSTIDYYGRRKPAFYTVKRVYQNSLLTGVCEEGLIRLTLINETRKKRNFCVKLWIADGAFNRIYEEEFFVCQPSFSAEKIWEKNVVEQIKGRERELFFGYKLFEGERECSRGAILFVSPKLFHWREGDISMHLNEDKTRLFISSNVFRKFVKVQGNDEIRLSDNCFDLIDNGTVELSVEEEKIQAETLKIYSLKDIR